MIPKIIRNGLEIASGNIIQKCFAILNILMLNGFLDISQFGLFMLMISIVNLSTQISIFSLPNVVYKIVGINRESSLLSGQLGNVLYTAMATSFIVCGILLVFSNSLSLVFLDITQVLNFQLAILLILSTSLTNVLNSILVGFDLARRSVLVSIIEVVARTFGLLLLLYSQGSITQVIGVYIVSSLISLCVAVYFAWGILKRTDFHFSFSEVRNTLLAAKSFFISSLAVTLIFNVDRLMLGAMVSAKEVGIFVLAATVANTILIVHSSLTTLFKPYAASALKKNDMEDLRKVYFSIANWSWSLSGVLFLFLNIFSVLLLSFFLNISIDSTVKNLLLVLTINAIMYISTGPSTSLLQMAGGYRQEVFNLLVFLFCNAVLNIYLIPKWGALGAALATSVACLLRLALQVYQIKSLLNFYVMTLPNLIALVLLTGTALLMNLLLLPLIFQLLILVLYSLIEIFRIYSNPTRSLPGKILD